MNRVERQYNEDKLKNALEEYIQCLRPSYSEESIKIEINTIVNEMLKIEEGK